MDSADRVRSVAAAEHHLVKPVKLSALRALLDRPNPRRTR
jgi:hypothetical protein